MKKNKKSFFFIFEPVYFNDDGVMTCVFFWIWIWT
jgi:hypothetical protein